jgi:vacuolar-type H+-ATPase subunit I/STV1
MLTFYEYHIQPKFPLLMVQLKSWRDIMGFIMDIVFYFVFYFGLLFLIIGTALSLFIMAALPKIWNKNLSFIMIGLGINILAIPLFFFIGGMATDFPDNSTRLDFWKGFFFIQKYRSFTDFFLLFLTVVLWFIRKNKKKVNM